MRPLPRFRLHPARLVEAPRVTDVARSGDHADVTVRGLLCGICAARAESALAAVEGVESVRVDLDGGRAVLRLSPGANMTAERLQRALERVAIAMPVRRMLERAAPGRCGGGER